MAPREGKDFVLLAALPWSACKGEGGEQTCRSRSVMYARATINRRRAKQGAAAVRPLPPREARPAPSRRQRADPHLRQRRCPRLRPAPTLRCLSPRRERAGCGGERWRAANGAERRRGGGGTRGGPRPTAPAPSCGGAGAAAPRASPSTVPADALPTVRDPMQPITPAGLREEAAVSAARKRRTKATGRGRKGAGAFSGRRRAGPAGTGAGSWPGTSAGCPRRGDAGRGIPRAGSAAPIGCRPPRPGEAGPGRAGPGRAVRPRGARERGGGGGLAGRRRAPRGLSRPPGQRRWAAGGRCCRTGGRRAGGAGGGGERPRKEKRGARGCWRWRRQHGRAGGRRFALVSR